MTTIQGNSCALTPGQERTSPEPPNSLYARPPLGGNQFLAFLHVLCSMDIPLNAKLSFGLGLNFM